MSYIETYQKFSKAIVEEHASVFSQLDMGQLKAFVDAVIEAKHIFVHGTGRDIHERVCHEACASWKARLLADG